MLAPFDLLVFFGSLAAVMAIGLWAARRENTTEDFFLAGRSVRWWGVAGSIFGTNVSANHLVGMLGIGYSIGFAQSHYELGAIAALMLLAYGFLPVYRRLRVFTLSEYLGQRFDERSRLLYALILLVLVLVQLTAAFYIGSRSLSLLLGGTALELSYGSGIAALALVTATYTIFGGLKAVIYTDVLQSVLLLLAGILVAVLTFAQPEVGGWSGMLAYDAARPAVEQKMHLYLPSDHPDLPWSGALSGLMVLHCFYWSTNQSIVQRTLAARSLREARIGIIAAGFLKLTIPFFAVAGGIAAAQLFDARLPSRLIDPDAATPELIRLVVPMGYGLMGLMVAGLIGAILSSIDSMVNSAATLFTFDIYRRWIRPQATDTELLPLGRGVIALLITVSAVLAAVTYDPAGGGNFFLRVSSQAGHFTPGLVVAFALGMFWRRAGAHGAFAAILLGPPFSFAVVELYRCWLAPRPAIESLLGEDLNFLHRVMATVVFCTLVAIVVSRLFPDKGGQDPSAARPPPGIGPESELPRHTLAAVALLGLALLALAGGVAAGLLPSRGAAWLAAAVTLAPFLAVWRATPEPRPLWADDRLWATLLCAATSFLMLRFF